MTVDRKIGLTTGNLEDFKNKIIQDRLESFGKKVQGREFSVMSTVGLIGGVIIAIAGVAFATLAVNAMAKLTKLI